MESIITKELAKCYICGDKKECIHHVFYGTANRKISDKYGLVVPLCNKCHNMSNMSVHHNRELDLIVKKAGQRAFEKKYNHEKFMQEIGKNYL